jgi:hypothetical protein
MRGPIFDLAFATGIAALQGDDLLSRSLAKELLRDQNTDGSWLAEENCASLKLPAPALGRIHVVSCIAISKG